jgi:hypothetical protein
MYPFFFFFLSQTGAPAPNRHLDCPDATVQARFEALLHTPRAADAVLRCLRRSVEARGVRATRPLTRSHFVCCVATVEYFVVVVVVVGWRWMFMVLTPCCIACYVPSRRVVCGPRGH